MKSLKSGSHQTESFTVTPGSKLSCILFAILFFPGLLFAQKNFQPGRIVNGNGDTTSGYIDYREWHTAPTSILFKPSGNEDAKELTVQDIYYFEVSGKEAYYSYTVRISMDPVDLNSISIIDTSSKTGTVFLKLVQKGNEAALFSYTDKLKPRFYILPRNTVQPQELVYKKYYSSDNNSYQQVITDDGYKNQLRQVMYAAKLSSEQLSKKINRVSYNESDLKKICLQLNQMEGGEQASVTKLTRTRWFAGAGVQCGKISFDGDNIFATNTVANNSSWLPRISGGFDLFSNPKIGKLLFRMEAGAQMNKSVLTAKWNPDKKATYALSYSTASVAAQVIYNIYNGAQIKIPAGIGLVYHFASYTKNEFKEIDPSGQEGNIKSNYVKLNANYPGYQARIGAVLKNKLELSLVYQRTASLTNYIFYNVNNRNVQLQLNYFFKMKNAAR